MNTPSNTHNTTYDYDYPLDFEKESKDLINFAKPYSMTTYERLYALYLSVVYLEKNNIEGDIVECGVWKGGSCMLAAKTLQLLGNTNRKIYLYDSFEGMAQPKDIDVSVDNESALETFNKSPKIEKNGTKITDWCFSPMEEVKENMAKTGYPEENIVYVKGLIENTIPQTLPEKIALLRLDTDWYDSTYHEMVHMYPKLVKKGVLIIDDYGHWKGSKKAIDDYFEQNNEFLLLNRVDSGRVAVKP